VYPTAKIGQDGNIGAFCEIGNNVVIGDRVRVGAMSYIPEGVTIEDDVFIGPRVTMTNDKYPPSGKENWKQTLIKKNAAIGAGVTIVCGVTIGECALIGAGSVVTKDVPAYQTWYGVPARPVLEQTKKEVLCSFLVK
jgi:UDP-2-acetamido-3-amino-2,3-dideoxy-glucuronate N-acetyltransferase